MVQRRRRVRGKGAANQAERPQTRPPRDVVAAWRAAEADKQSLLAKLGRPAVSDVIVGSQSGLCHAMERVDQVAKSDVPVLLLGETGSGKEVLARAIHERSDRAHEPFIRVNCGAIPPDLADSELFGHERGSFTGAAATRRGWFEQADGGSLFLDEVAELPLAVQVRLLRVLQDSTFQRVGGDRAIKVDVRIIAATHRDLQLMVSEARFREDLWYRLAVFPIRIPALRERPEDIPALASHFAARAAKRFGTPVLLPSDSDLQLLTAYEWPGNARELQSVMDRAVILGNGKCLEIAKSLGVLPRTSGVLATSPVAPLQPATSQSLASLDDAMRQHIEAALTLTHGRVDGHNGAAKILGINAHTLRGRMRKLKVDWRKFRAR